MSIAATNQDTYNMHHDRKYLILNVSEMHLIDFEEVLENSPNTLRYTNDGTKTFIKWLGSDPTPIFVQNLTTSEGPYNYDEFIEIMKNPEWIIIAGSYYL